MKATVPLRLLGIASSVSLVSRVAEVVETTSTTGEAPETVTVSAIRAQLQLHVDLRHERRRQDDAFAPHRLKA